MDLITLTRGVLTSNFIFATQEAAQDWADDLLASKAATPLLHRIDVYPCHDKPNCASLTEAIQRGDRVAGKIKPTEIPFHIDD